MTELDSLYPLQLNRFFIYEKMPHYRHDQFYSK